MVEVMGGMDGVQYTKFKTLCFTTFLLLRRNHERVINLFSIMVSSTYFYLIDLKANCGLPDFALLDPEKVIQTVLEKFKLQMNDEEAVNYFNSLLNESVNALFPKVMERIHQFAQYWRG